MRYMLAWLMLGTACSSLAETKTAIVHRSTVEADGHFSYWLDFPGVNPMEKKIQGLWNSEQGDYVVVLDPGVKLLRVQGFAATDIGTVFEGDLNLIAPGGRALALFAPHKERPFENRDAWGERLIPDGYTVPVDNPVLSVRWVCRATGPSWDPKTYTMTGRVEARCHFGMSIDAKQ